MRFFEKIQQLPEKKRKIILWSVIIILGAGLLFWWVNNLQKRVTGFPSEQLLEGLDLPEIEMPEIPELSEETLEKLKGTLEENGQ